MSQTLSILMAQINPTVGAISANAEKIIDIIQVNTNDHDLIVFPELALTGYPPEDLLLREEFFFQIERALKKIQENTGNCHVIVGHPTLDDDQCFNAASIFFQQTCIAIYHKQRLPNYGVFDEQRYFVSGKAQPCIFKIKNYRLGLCICEDIWGQGPVDQIINDGADILVCINASPFEENKYAIRESVLRAWARRGLSIVYVNQIGGQDELVFDGQSLVLDNTGNVCARSPAFIEDLQTVQIKRKTITANIAPLLSREALIYQALLCGLNDYVNKNNFPGVLLGLSGGIDSALVLALAVDALGASRVHAVLMPSRYTASMSIEDAIQQADAMQVSHTTLSIEPTFKTLLTTLSPCFHGLTSDTTEENLQARIRGILLMALSNKTGNMLLSTSNKSETAVGYCTLYGDMAGGFSVLKDVLKTTVYSLAHYRNTLSPVIPLRVLTRAPSAELAGNQTDQDSLPDYAILDAIITAYMEDNLGANEIIAKGYKPEDVLHTIKLIKRNEYKRYQAPPGVKISLRAFGRDWRTPITSGFHN
jgi:NAD+ synthase (glutamine-hydrolysing)